MTSSTESPLLSIRLEGDAIGSGRIPIDHLLRLLSEFDKAIYRTGIVLKGGIDSIRRGQRQQSIKKVLDLDLVGIKHGSPATVLEFKRREPPLPNLPDFGVEVLERSLRGLSDIQQPGTEMPAGMDSGVMLKWRDVGLLFQHGVTKIQFALNHRPQPFSTTYSPAGFAEIERRILGPTTNIRTIEGRLLMADFKEHGTRCRIHPSASEPVLCFFDESKTDEVLENILHYVRIVGEAKEDPLLHKIVSVVISDIQRVEDQENKDTRLLPVGTPLPSEFWRSPSLDELAQAQGVHPIDDVSVLFDTWPGTPDDGFEESILSLRRDNVARRRH